MHNPFHLAIEVHNLDLARAFYVKVLGCEEGRSDLKWIDFNLFGHQLVCHLNENMDKTRVANLVDGEEVPIPHFGVILEMNEWKILADRLVRLKIKFAIKPYIRFKDLPGEQATMFFYDPSGNAIELKAFNDIKRQLFKK
ncbi:MAG: glyoxalase [Candidatus Marinimicrobia bacterium]|nr:glyoxalase [Candidatus Neomarinimicrobiota bacterium]